MTADLVGNKINTPKPYYDEGGVTIYHGDCREVLPALGIKADLMLTDPPYGITSVKGDGKMGGSVAAPNRVYLPVHGDDDPMYVRWLLPYAERHVIWGAEHFRDHPGGGRLLVWDKRVGMASNDFADIEAAWDSGSGPSRIYRHRQVGMLHDGYGDVDRVHPNQKPLAIMAWCLELVGAAELVLDPFVGSGTTLRAAKAAGRRAVGVEIEEKYCEIAAKRLMQQTLGLEVA